MPFGKQGSEPLGSDPESKPIKLQHLPEFPNRIDRKNKLESKWKTSHLKYS